VHLRHFLWGLVIWILRGFFFLEFEAGDPGSLVDHAAGHLPGFETQGLAPPGKILVPGDEKMPALKTIDFFFLHPIPWRGIPRSAGHRAPAVLAGPGRGKTKPIF
jgi:hypothetical protein